MREKVPRVVTVIIAARIEQHTYDDLKKIRTLSYLIRK